MRFIPTAKLCGGKSYSIVSDYLGRPAQAYDDKGELVWQVEIDIYGRIRENLFNNKSFIPFRQLGQYEDVETGLYYNRFRYYDSNTGTYISQDPIKLEGNNPNFYAYVSDSNAGIDPFGLFYPKILTEGSVFRGVKIGQEPFFPSLDDIAHFKNTGSMPELSTKPKLNSQATKFFEKIGVTNFWK